MRRTIFINLAVGGMFFLSFLFGGCASQPKKQTVPVPLEKEIKSIEGATSSGTSYFVNKGDTLWRISKKYGVSVEQLLNANNITDVKNLKVGQTLIIPGHGKSNATYAKFTNTSPASTVARKMSATGFIWPVKGKTISYYDDFMNGTKHAGIYILPEPGQKVVAAKKGTVEAVSNLGDNKHVLVIKHAWGVRTFYGCCCTLLVGEGAYVEQGHPIANLLQNGPNVLKEISFKIYIKDKPVNPLLHLP
ncbi:MAG: LysM peptidoglycan-binding domain-containing protein [Candidatus Brocadiaceae bacterium]|nr:LysM peptidoglycan-binding domain-containing protein [Candidatus Brocadiaceae bacterium]